jgi:hypothetical protein
LSNAPRPPPNPEAPASAAAEAGVAASQTDAPIAVHAPFEFADDESPRAALRRKNEQRMPQPWQRLPWHQRVPTVAYLWWRVALDYAHGMVMGVRWLLRQWLKRYPGAAWRVAETVFWPALFLYIGWVSNSGNPLYLNEGFPWPWLGPWLIALRYGTGYGVAASLLLLLAWSLLGSPGSDVRLYFLGGGIVTLIAGEFGSFWGERLGKQQESARYLEDKIERLTRRLYLLKLSHDELEYEMVERPGTLRDALTDLRRRLEAIGHKGERLAGAREMMAFLALYGQIESGGIFEYIDGPKPEVRKRASVGLSEPPDAQHPMIRRAIESKQSVHLLDQLADRVSDQELMAVMPMFDERGEVLGVLTINRLPFMAFNADNLRNLWVLLQAYAEFCRLRSDAAVLQKDWADAPVELRQEWTWLSRMHRDHGVPSVCAVWRLEGLQATAAANYLRLAHEQGNMAWVLAGAIPHSQIVITLLPFLSGKRHALLQEQLRNELRMRFGNEVLINCAVIDLSAEHALAQVKNLQTQEPV